jgi:imidazolonepropionase-like amidohydrolase
VRSLGDGQTGHRQRGGIGDCRPGRVEGMRRALAAQYDVVRAAAERGVPVLAGTDAGMGPHGQVEELRRPAVILLRGQQIR